jgi:hypothetical protein
MKRPIAERSKTDDADEALLDAARFVAHCEDRHLDEEKAWDAY